MTASEFEVRVGDAPENDDLDRANCREAGTVGHSFCGVCACGRPKFICGGNGSEICWTPWRGPRSLHVRWQTGAVTVRAWFERDRAHVEVREVDTDRTIVEWLDTDVTAAFDDGFFRRGDHFERSVIDYAEHLSLQ